MNNQPFYINFQNQDLLRETQDRRVQLEDMLRRAEEQQQQVRIIHF
jgi:hypothetical protein